MFEVVKLNGEFVVVTTDHTMVLVESDSSSIPSANQFCRLAESIEIVDGKPKWKRESIPKKFVSFEDAEDLVKTIRTFTSITSPFSF